MGPHEGQMAPPVGAPTLDGEVITMTDWRGEPSLLVFWASWCAPCRKEAPEVVKLVEHYGERVHVAGVNVGEDAETAAAAAQGMGLNYPVLLDEDGGMQKAWDVSEIPLVVVLGREGRVRYRGARLPPDVYTLLDSLRQPDAIHGQ